MSTNRSKLIFTETDEAPALATYSLLPTVRAFTQAAGIEVEARDISLSGRILAVFPDYLDAEQRIPDELTHLGELTQNPETNIIKLPNISASLPQLNAAIKELQAQGYAIPDHPNDPQTDAERDIRARYDRVKGSAVNPVLREGNSDRRAPGAVKNYARKHPHRMGEWAADNKTHVVHMEEGDFFGSEKSTTLTSADDLKVVLVKDSGETVLKDSIPVLAGEVVDAAVMSVGKLRAFYDQVRDAAGEENLLLSLHLKATMMKVSDPIIFGHMVRSYFSDFLERYAEELSALEYSPNDGLGVLESRIAELPAAQRDAMQADLKAVYTKRPELAMVNSDKGITNLHVPSDVIVDASMPAMIRDGGKMWAPDNSQKETKAVIPDRSYAGIYKEAVEFCKENGAFDPTTMGTVPNVGLMAQKAEEYGSHDKTFEIPADGRVQVRNRAGEIIFEHSVQRGDIWRMCQVKDAPIRDWVSLAVRRSRLSGMPAVFWLNEERAHDRELITKVNAYLKEEDTSGLDIRILSPIQATRHTMQRVKDGKDTISVTGNVLRDYLTDLFPILELGTSAKMLSIVPLMQGGGLFETGAGGSAPKHVQQFAEENHLRWDSLGEFLALGASLEHLGQVETNAKATVLAETLDAATAQFLENDKSPSRKVGELDNRGSHFYLALYWARALADQNQDKDLQARFAPVAEQMEAQEGTIVQELNQVQGQPVDLGGYYRPSAEKIAAAMRPSPSLNAILQSI